MQVLQTISLRQCYFYSSVLVTGALLVSTGNCTVVGNTISVDASTRLPSYSAVRNQDFRSNRNLEVENIVSMIASRLFRDESIVTTYSNIKPVTDLKNGNMGSGNTLIVTVAILATFLFTSTLSIVFILCLVCRSWKKRTNMILKNTAEDTFKLETKSMEPSLRNDEDPLDYGIPEVAQNVCYISKNDSGIEFSFEVERIISFTDLNLVKIIGKGEFGIVYLAEVTRSHNGDKQYVAAKTLNESSFDHEDMEKFKKECRTICHLDHPNVLPLIGICFRDKVPYLIMPLMERGSLLTYLRKERESLLLLKDSDEDEISIARKNLLDMCYQIAKGMEYITRVGLVHRDLAARNCLIDGQGKIRVSDFGLSESIYTKIYLQLQKHKYIKLPVKWTAPESINDGIFSEKTDMWSFGVTCWEVYSAGKSPYPGIHPLNVINMVEEGYRMEKPNNKACADTMYTLMMECWNIDSKRRSTFSDLVKTLSNELELLSDYFIVTIADEH